MPEEPFLSATDIFLSYNREDAATAKRFADAFAAEGLNVWWDQTLRSGEAYDEVTEAALRNAKAVVVLWSPRSVISRWVRAEATIADRCKTLVPVMIEACDRPIMFELTQTAELGHWQGDTRDKAWQAFLSDIYRFLGREAAALAPTVPASPIDPSIEDFEKLARRQQISFCRARDGVTLAYSRIGEGPPLVKSGNWLNHLEYEMESPLWATGSTNYRGVEH